MKHGAYEVYHGVDGVESFLGVDRREAAIEGLWVWVWCVCVRAEAEGRRDVT